MNKNIQLQINKEMKIQKGNPFTAKHDYSRFNPFY